jgi:hypothetical protein
MSGYENYGLETGKLVNPDQIPRFLDISEDFEDKGVPILDQKAVKLRGITSDQQHWRDYGYVIKRNFIPHDLIAEYIDIRQKLNLGDGLFPDITPYLYHSAIRYVLFSRIALFISRFVGRGAWVALPIDWFQVDRTRLASG